MSEQVDKLRSYAMMESDEFSEACLCLIELYHYKYCINDELKDLLEKEISEKLNWYEKNTEIVEREETYTKKIRELVPKT